ncbi:UNVERIFIED_CONTAM: hypothetical protein FKN15_021351 [Acipenser sinensis]
MLHLFQAWVRSVWGFLQILWASQQRSRQLPFPPALSLLLLELLKRWSLKLHTVTLLPQKLRLFQAWVRSVWGFLQILWVSRQRSRQLPFPPSLSLLLLELLKLHTVTLLPQKLRLFQAWVRSVWGFLQILWVSQQRSCQLPFPPALSLLLLELLKRWSLKRHTVTLVPQKLRLFQAWARNVWGSHLKLHTVKSELLKLRLSLESGGRTQNLQGRDWSRLLGKGAPPSCPRTLARRPCGRRGLSSSVAPGPRGPRCCLR